MRFIPIAPLFALTALINQTLMLPAARADKMPAPAIIDDRDDAWTWNGATEYSESGLNNATGETVGPHGFGVCLFSGTGAALYGMSGSSVTIDDKTHPFGKVKITIDGHLKGVVSLISPDTEYGHKIFSITGLRPGNHVLEVRTVDGEAVIDYLKPLAKDSDDTPAPAPKRVVHRENGPEYSDTFVTGGEDWVPYGGSQHIVDGHYVIAGDGGNKALQGDLSYQDLTFSCNIAIGSGTDAGLIFRVTNPSAGTDSYNGYYAGFDLNGKQIILGRASNAWTLIKATPFPVQANMVYNMKVVAQGPHISVFINGQLIFTADDSTFTEGGIGVRGFNSTSAFSNLHVSPM